MRTADHAARAFALCAAFVVALQTFVGFLGVDDALTRGHNGFNTAAYVLSARNSLRWHEVLPHQYYTDPVPPPSIDAYTHAPLALHFHNVVSFAIFGDTPGSIRGVAALNGIFVVVTMLIVVARFFTRWHAAFAAAMYVMLPINLIFANMTNHSAGCIGWTLWMLYFWLRYREDGHTRWLAGLIASSGMATFWDWPSYYVAFFVAVHWFAWMCASWLRQWRNRRRPADTSEPAVDGPPPTRTIRWTAIFPLGLFCIWILGMVAAFLLVLYLQTDSLDDLINTFSARQGADLSGFARNVQVVPEMMFTWPVLGLCAAWLLHFIGRTLIGRFEPRDLITISFGLAGVMHYYIFRSDAVVHEYWLWPALPFAGLACADVLYRIADLFERKWPRVRLVLLATLPLIAFVPLAIRAVELVPLGRHVGGSMWFVSTVRADRPQAYDSSRAELRFAEKVRGWTERSTGVLVHARMEIYPLECRFSTTIDRALVHQHGFRPYAPRREGVESWVFIGLASDLPASDLHWLASQYVVRLYDQFFFVDMRTPNPVPGRIERIELTPKAPTLGWMLFHSPFEPDVVETITHEMVP